MKSMKLPQSIKLMFQASNFWSRVVEWPQARKNTIKFDERSLLNPASLVQQANKMISKSLGKLHKVRVQGSDTNGFTYQSYDQMWRSQLDPLYIEANKSASAVVSTPAQSAAAEESKEASQLPASGSKQAWYSGSVDYWNKQPATVDGVLGGYESIHSTESDTSKTMISSFKHLLPSMSTALDCGAGIGRVTKEVLKPFF